MKKHLHYSLRALFLSLAVLLSLPMLAESVEIDGIWYDLDVETKQATVTSKSSGGYSGKVVIPETVEFKRTSHSVTSIGSDAFNGCKGLTSVTIPNSVTSIGEYAFDRCSGLTSVTIPNSVTSIGEYAFYGCSGLTSVTISNRVTYIGVGAFRNCSGLTSVTIPNSVMSIGKNAFRNCSGLTSVTIPNSVTSIGERAFDSCSGLTSVIIPNSVTSIGEWAFYGCSELLDVYCHAEKVPSTGIDIFGNSPIQKVTLHVPAASIESYKATEPWSSFGKIVALTDEETGIENIDANAENSVIYDLSGHRVQNTQKGIYIKNSKKVMVK